jgi:hypothetical protein
LPERTLALGQLFFADGGRGGRRDGKPYEAVVRLSADQIDTSAGFRVRIGGRIVRAGKLGPVSCRPSAQPEQRPVCLVNVVVDEVAVENSADGSTLATWTPGSGKAPEA